MSFGRQYISACLKGSSPAEFMQGAREHLFLQAELPLYTFVWEFVKSYSKLPSIDTVKKNVDTVWLAAEEPPSYYLDLMGERFIERRLKETLKSADAKLGATGKDIKAAIKIVVDAAGELTRERFSKNIVDFRDAYNPVIGAYTAKLANSEQYGLHFGWKKLDKMTGGVTKGDLVSLVGRPQQGKTWQMLYSALYGWILQGKTVDPDYNQSRLFVSMEMPSLQIQQRMAAMFTHMPMSQFKAGIASKNWTTLKKGLIEVKGFGAPFYIVDGNLTATVDDIANLARLLNPSAIFIDGGYLLKHPTERDRFRRVAENADLIKSVLCPLAPTVCSWQFARKKKDNKAAQSGQPARADLDDIGYTDAIAQVSSIVLGIFQEDGIESLRQKLIEILKGRSGETGTFTTNWNFDSMDFSEIAVESMEDLQIA